MEKKAEHMKTRAVRLVVLSAFAALIAGPAAADGAQLFKTRCGICHWDPAQAGEKPRRPKAAREAVHQLLACNDEAIEKSRK